MNDGIQTSPRMMHHTEEDMMEMSWLSGLGTDPDMPTWRCVGQECV